MRTVPSARVLVSVLAPFLAPVLAVAPLALSACKSGSSQPPPPPASTGKSAQGAKPGHRAEITNEFAAAAEIVSLSPETRALTVRREDGTQFDLVAGPEVRNFDQLSAGDVLKLKYRETLIAEVRPADEPAPPPQAAFAAARAKPGSKPGAGMGAAVSVRVRIESIDRERDIVVFAPASGELMARRVRTSQGREFVKSLQVGDMVQLAYAEVVALEVEELK